MTILRRCLATINGWLLPEGLKGSRLPYVWLIYLAVFYLSPLVLVDLPAWHVWSISLSSLLFLALYFRAYHAQPRELLLILAAMVLLGVWASFYYMGSAVFFIYAACAAADLGSQRRGALAVVVIATLGVVTGLWLAPHWSSALVAGFFSLVNGGLCVHFREVERGQRALRLSQQEVRHLATSAERERIARDLHDVLGHTLSVIALKAELAGKLVERDAQRAREELDDLQRISREALSDVRRAVSGYRHSRLSEELATARMALECAEIAFEYRLPDTELSQHQEQLLAMIVREATTNVLRHSGATRCVLDLRVEGAEVALTFHDNGRGGAEADGNGKRGIRERVTAEGGRVEWRDDGGLALMLRMPLEQAA